MPSAMLTSKGQITIPLEVRRVMGLTTGERVEFVPIAPEQYALVAATGSVKSLKGSLKAHAAPTGRPVSLADMQAAIAAEASKALEP